MFNHHQQTFTLFIYHIKYLICSHNLLLKCMNKEHNLTCSITRTVISLTPNKALLLIPYYNILNTLQCFLSPIAIQ